MLRCVRAAFAAACAFAPSFLLLTASPVAHAQIVMQRAFPSNALRGWLVVGQPPEVLLNGQPQRLAPGARVRGENNLIVVSGALTGVPLLVHYTLNTEGELADVWILTPGERANTPWPATVDQAQRWTFDPIAQTWTR